jgi:hypothetical protein
MDASDVEMKDASNFNQLPQKRAPALSSSVLLEFCREIYCRIARQEDDLKEIKDLVTIVIEALQNGANGRESEENLEPSSKKPSQS